VEFVVGLLSFAGALAWTLWAVRRGPGARAATLWTAAALEAGVLGTLWLDWGYSWVEQTALHVALEQTVWVALPHALAVLVLMGLARWGASFSPWASVLAAAQAVLCIPILLRLEQTLSMSFLAAAPMAALYASVVAALLFLPAACAALPAAGTHWHRVAFGRREALLHAVEGLGDLGLAIEGPATVLESGEAAGRLGEADVRVSTLPSLWPLSYGLTVEVRRPGAPAGGLEVPGFARRETVRVDDGRVRYRGDSPEAFAITPQALRDFVRSLAA
jgi:hypothetical protein